jgi:hypothetical protein
LGRRFCLQLPNTNPPKYPVDGVTAVGTHAIEAVAAKLRYWNFTVPVIPNVRGSPMVEKSRPRPPSAGLRKARPASSVPITDNTSTPAIKMHVISAAPLRPR